MPFYQVLNENSCDKMYWKSTLNLWDKIDYLDSLNSQFQTEDITSNTVNHCNSINIYVCGVGYRMTYSLIDCLMFTNK